MSDGTIRARTTVEYHAGRWQVVVRLDAGGHAQREYSVACASESDAERYAEEVAAKLRSTLVRATTPTQARRLGNE